MAGRLLWFEGGGDLGGGATARAVNDVAAEAGELRRNAVVDHRGCCSVVVALQSSAGALCWK